jgi:hypothetical protein
MVQYATAKPCVRGASSLAAPRQTSCVESRRTSKALYRVRRLPRRLRALRGLPPSYSMIWMVRSPCPQRGSWRWVSWVSPLETRA